MFNEGRWTSLIGKILTLTEVLGLEDKQAESLKSLIRQEMWSAWENCWGTDEKETMFGQGDENGNGVEKE